MAPLTFLPLDNLKSMVMDRRLHEAPADASLGVLRRLTEDTAKSGFTTCLRALRDTITHPKNSPSTGSTWVDRWILDLSGESRCRPCKAA